ncbi:hypothetical protein C0J52_27802 [Blattella germanica]|nr:hypothetical protein C0J52_27802 [Blattella germanica]
MAATSTSDHEDEADSENYFLPNTRGTVKRKRTRNEVLWKKKNAKMCRNRGLQYVSLKTHKVVPAKIRGRGCACAVKSETANLKWCEYHKLTDEVKDKLFTEFYKLGDYNAQNAFLFGLVFRRQCNRIYEFKRRQSDESRRKFSFMYSVKDANGDTVRVCAKAFCDIFAISRKRLSTARGDRKAIDKSEFENINEGNESNNDSKSNHCEPEIVLTKFGPHLDCRGRHGKQKSRKEEFGS